MSDLYLTVNPLEASQTAIMKTMRIAENGEHTPGAWRDEGALHHLKHSLQHTMNAYNLLLAGDPRWREELEHSHTRDAFAFDCADRGLLDDFGTEGKGL